LRAPQRAQGDRGLDGAVCADAGGYRLGTLRVLADDGEIVAAREHAAADPRAVLPVPMIVTCMVLLISGRGGDEKHDLAVRARASRPCMPW
jgi:hypothetical protein